MYLDLYCKSKCKHSDHQSSNMDVPSQFSMGFVETSKTKFEPKSTHY